MGRFYTKLMAASVLLLSGAYGSVHSEDDQASSIAAQSGTPTVLVLSQMHRLPDEDDSQGLDDTVLVVDGHDTHRTIVTPRPGDGIQIHMLAAPSDEPRIEAPEIAALALDGGGVRGYFQALILSALEEEFRRCLDVDPAMSAKDKPRLVEAFDLVGGTSAGAIGAGCLTVADETGMRPLHDLSTLLSFYEGDARDAAGNPTFANPPVAGMFNRSLARRIKTGFGLLNERYSSDPMRRALSAYGLDVPLAQACVPTLIVTTELRNDDIGCRPIHFKSYDMGEFPGLTAAQAALCSGAAPTYFERMAVDDASGMERYFVDGGLTGANNPAVVLTPEIFSLRHGLRKKNLLFVSVGTGIAPIQVNGRKAANFGLVDWVVPIIDLTLGMPTLTNEAIMETLFRHQDPTRPGGYMRWSPALGQKITLDDASPRNLALMRQVALTFIDARQGEIKEAAQKLARRYQVKLEARASGHEESIVPGGASFSAFTSVSPPAH